MGIHGVWPLLSGEDVDVDDLAGKRLCIDGNILLFPCLRSTNARFVTEYTLVAIGRILGMKIDPLVVLDGRRPMYKRRGGILQSIPQKKSGNTLPAPNTQHSTVPNRAEEPEAEVFSARQVADILDRHARIRRKTVQRVYGDKKQRYILSRKEGTSSTPQNEDRTPSAALHRANLGDYTKTEKAMDIINELIALAEDVEEDREEDVEEKEDDDAESPKYTDLKQPRSPEPRPVLQHPHKEQSLLVPLDFCSRTSEYHREVREYGEKKQDVYLKKSTFRIDVPDSDEPLLHHSPPNAWKTAAGSWNEMEDRQHPLICDVLDALGVKYCVAPGEADAAYMNIERALGTEGVITEDSDVLLFTSHAVYRHLCRKPRSRSTQSSVQASVHMPRKVRKYSASRQDLGYAWEELVILAWLLGSDYSAGIRGIGNKKAVRVIQEYRKGVGEEKGKYEPAIASSSGRSDIEMHILAKAVAKVLHPGKDEISPSAQDMQALERLCSIYSQTSGLVEVKNLEKEGEVNRDALHTLISRRTSWSAEQMQAYLSMLDRSGA